MRLGQNLLQQGAAGGGGPLVGEVFSTSLYTGNGSTQTITNGIDLAGEGGMVWCKDRDIAFAGMIVDTERGGGLKLEPQSTAVEGYKNTITGFTNSGFTLGNALETNYSNSSNVSWTFRKAPQFFDVVTYTGDGVAGRTIPHNLGVEPGMILVKNIDASTDWAVYHRELNGGTTPEQFYLFLNNTNSESSVFNYWNDTSPSDTEFTVNNNNRVNASGNDYVAYLFAHDIETAGVIQCGSYTGNGSATGPTISLGWEPQWLLLKRTDSTGDWIIHDNARDTSNPRTAFLKTNTSAAEANGNDVDFTSSGFQLKSTSATVNASGGTYAYVAIRAEGA